MSHELSGKKIAFLVAPFGVEHAQLANPWRAVKLAGGKPILVSTGHGPIQAVHRGVRTSETIHVDRIIEELNIGECAALVLPGGLDNSASLRERPDAIGVVAEFVRAGKAVAAIEHGPGILVNAGVLAGKVLTSSPGMEAEIVKAGGTWMDEEVRFCPDHGWMLVTGRSSLGLSSFTKAMVTAFI